MSARALRRGLLLSLALSVAGVVLLVLAGGGRRVLAAVSEAHPGWYGLAVGLILLAWWLRAWRIAVLARAMGHRLAVSRSWTFYLSSVFVSHVTPASSGGLPVLLALLVRDGMPAGRASALVLLESALTSLVFAVAAPLLILAGPVAHLASGLRASLATLVGAFAGVAALLLALLLWPDLLGRLAVRAGGSRPLLRLLGPVRAARWRRVARREARRFTLAMRWMVARRWSALLGTLLLSLFYWAAYLAILPVLMAGLGVRFTWYAPVAVQLLFNLVQPAIPTPGGSGGAELLFAYLVRGLVPPDQVSPLVLLWRSVTFYLSLLLGGLATILSLRPLAGRPLAERRAP
ncbi:MAG: flippase-like domain-containing protein [Clostridia bacterium]|nr:flippase-like domain-containing protein [Clostridia bacterium]MCL6521501.1 flippase-like domain-containing protein [Bacillota bacterium]